MAPFVVRHQHQPESYPAQDPDEACRRAIEAGLVLQRAHPLNAETPIPALIGGVVMPSAHFYVRNHFPIPRVDSATWRLQIGGLVERPLSLSLRDLFNMRSQTLLVTLECAGNGRSLLNPRVDGEQWGLGAVSTAEWTGVPLSEVLDRARLRPDAREVVFRGADRGNLEGRTEPIRFERSLTFDQVRDTEALLAYAMNGEALPIRHGYPLRLVVPGWYGVASVKWLSEVEATATPLTAYHQTEKYWYEWPRDGQVVREPVTVQRVRALITDPLPDQTVEPGVLTVRGVAWSGGAAIERVEVSIGDGRWEQARFVGVRHPHSWQRWELITTVGKRDSMTVRARATDTAGRTQPDRPEWNRLGYGSNPIQEVTVHIGQPNTGGPAATPAAR